MLAWESHLNKKTKFDFATKEKGHKAIAEGYECVGLTEILLPAALSCST